MHTNGRYNNFVDVVIKCGKLTCSLRHLNITYMLSSTRMREKILPSFNRNDNDLRSYLLDVKTNGTRPCLKIIVAEEEVQEVIEEVAAVPFKRSHQTSNVVTAPIPSPPPPHTPILEVDKKKCWQMAAIDFSCFG